VNQQVNPQQQYVGKIHTLNDKGYGFIDPGGGQHIFFHAHGLVLPLTFNDLTVGETVHYKIQAGNGTADQRDRAICVRRCCGGAADDQ